MNADSFPERQPRLRLRQLTDDEYDTAAAAVAHMANALACKISDATDWATTEGYICSDPRAASRRAARVHDRAAVDAAADAAATAVSPAAAPAAA